MTTQTFFFSPFLYGGMAYFQLMRAYMRYWLNELNNLLFRGNCSAWTKNGVLDDLDHVLSIHIETMDGGGTGHDST